VSSGSPTSVLEAPAAATSVTALQGEGAELVERTKRRLSVAIPAANAIGGVVVFGFLAYVAPTPVGAGQHALTRFNLLLFAIFFPLAMAAGRYWSLRRTQPIRDWLLEARRPTERERDITLRHPLVLAEASAAIWVAGAIVFGAANIHRSIGLAVEIVVVTLLGGLATCAMLYLVSERIVRPVTARVLAQGAPGRPALPGVATRMLLAWAFGTGLAVVGAGLVAVIFLAGGDTSPRRLASTVVFLSVVALLAGLASVVIAARSVADPVNSVRRALAEVEGGKVDASVPVDDSSEVGLLQAGFNRMAAGLRERDRIRDLFGRHVGEEVARQALARGLELGGETREVAILFVDVVGSTRLAATTDPSSVVDTLNRFFALVVEITTLHGGWVNKFEGDAALCVFGAPTEHPDPASAALAAGRALDAALRTEVPNIESAIGLSAGPVVAGNVGAAERFEYTVIGDPVNEAARLTELAKTTPGRILASDAILNRAKDPERHRWMPGEAVTLRGRTQATRPAAPKPHEP
jgi:adenylate cyclase